MDMTIVEFLAAPFVASLILTGIHAYLGVHVVERGVIFVDLSLAQIAALGATIALLMPFSGGDVHAPSVYWVSLAFIALMTSSVCCGVGGMPGFGSTKPITFRPKASAKLVQERW